MAAAEGLDQPGACSRGPEFQAGAPGLRGEDCDPGRPEGLRPRLVPTTNMCDTHLGDPVLWPRLTLAVTNLDIQSY